MLASAMICAEVLGSAPCPTEGGAVRMASGKASETCRLEIPEALAVEDINESLLRSRSRMPSPAARELITLGEELSKALSPSEVC